MTVLHQLSPVYGLRSLSQHQHLYDHDPWRLHHHLLQVRHVRHDVGQRDPQGVHGPERDARHRAAHDGLRLTDGARAGAAHDHRGALRMRHLAGLADVPLRQRVQPQAQDGLPGHQKV